MVFGQFKGKMSYLGRLEPAVKEILMTLTNIACKLFLTLWTAQVILSFFYY